MKKYLLLVFTLLLSSITFAQTKNNRSETEKRLLSAAKKDRKYIDAYVAVHEIQNMVSPESKGLYRNEDIINDFNERLGPYMGKETTIIGVRKRIKDGNKLLKFLQLKIAAKLALEEAATQE